MMMHLKTRVLLTLALGFTCCTVSKEARSLKKATQSWRQSKIVMHAYADTPFSGIFLTLRENGKFEHTSSGLFKSFEAGTWVSTNDTILLNYLDAAQNIVHHQNVFRDKTGSILLFENDTSQVPMKFRIMLDKL